MFASRLIEGGEELTYDYNFESFGTRQACRCGTKLCKGFIWTSRLDAKVPEYKARASAVAKQLAAAEEDARRSDESPAVSAYMAPAKPRERPVYAPPAKLVFGRITKKPPAPAAAVAAEGGSGGGLSRVGWDFGYPL